MGFQGVSAKNLVDHLMDRYGNIWASYLEACRKSLAEPIEVDFLINVYLQRAEDAIQFAQDGNATFTPTQIVQTEYHAVNKTGLYYLSLKEWRKKATADKTWASFKQVFAEEYHNLVDETKVTNGNAGFHSANMMQDIGGALEHLYMAAVADKEIFTKLTEAVDTLTRKKSPFTTQLRNAMNINLEKAKKLILKATQAQKSEDKRLKEISIKKAAFESNLEPDG